MGDEIIYEVVDGIGTLTINRPESRNALNWAAQEQFAAAVEAASTNPELRVVIITGSGDKAFASGGDLKELATTLDQSTGERLNRIMNSVLDRLTKLPVPVLAAVNGDAIGGGCEILTACDLRFATVKARFQFAQVRVGLTTGWGGTGRLVRLLGLSRATDLILTGRILEASEAKQLGLLHQIVPEASDILSFVRRWAEKLAILPSQAVAANKALLHSAASEPLVMVNQLEAQLFRDLWLKPDHLEAMAAFNEKRQPIFNRRSEE
jgi:enoyl-CoA hydratase/carnithine racemase